LEVGRPAPDFSLQDHTGKTVTKKSLAGKWAVLYFYPKDMTPGCTTEACDFRDRFERLAAAGAVVYGVSGDSLESHRKFAAAHRLPFPLLADPEKTMIASYGAWGEKKMYGRTRMGIIRSTVLLDPKGVVRAVWPKVKVAGHVDEVLAGLDALRGDDDDGGRAASGSTGGTPRASRRK
jgi:peroxiredoxin Q/BCP